MTLYRYKGLQDKRTVTGMLDAPTLAEFLEKLVAQNIHVLWYFPNPWISKRLSFQDSLALSSHLEYLLKAGLSLHTALYHISRQSSRSLRTSALFLQKKIEGGFSLSEAIRSEKTFFDPVFIELITIGEANGNLAQSFAHIKVYLLWKNKFQKTLVQSLRYPFILFFLLIVLMITLTTFLVPPLKSFLVAMNLEQSLSTSLLLRFTDVWCHYGSFVFLGFIFTSVSFFFLTRVKKIKYLWHKTLIHIPLLGPFLVKLWIIRIRMSLFLLLKSDIFLLKALQITATQTDNLYLTSILERVRAQLTKGQSLSHSFESVKTIPSLMSHFIKAGEESNNLTDSFLTIRDYYSEMAHYQIDFLKDFLPILCLLLMGGFLIWVVLGIFYPLYNVSGL